MVDHTMRTKKANTTKMKTTLVLLLLTIDTKVS